MYGKNRFNFWFDLTILIAFLLTALTGLLLWLVIPDGRGSGQLIFLGLTRRIWVDLHNWSGLAMLVGAALHLALHWQWISCVARRFFTGLARQARVNFSLDNLLFLAFFLVNLSGLVVWLVLPSGGYRGGRNPYYNATLLDMTRHNWQDLHLWAGLTMIAVLTIHLFLHWRWLVCVARRYARAAARQSDECAVA